MTTIHKAETGYNDIKFIAPEKMFEPKAMTHYCGTINTMIHVSIGYLHHKGMYGLYVGSYDKYYDDSIPFDFIVSREGSIGFILSESKTIIAPAGQIIKGLKSLTTKDYSCGKREDIDFNNTEVLSQYPVVIQRFMEDLEEILKKERGID